MTKQELNCSEVEAARKPSARCFVPEIMPVEIDLGELVAIHASTRASPPRLDSVRQQHQ